MEHPILLYLGTIFVAFEVVRRVGHLGGFLLLLPAAIVLYKYLPRMPIRGKKQEGLLFNRIARQVVFILSAIIVLSALFILVAMALIVDAIGHIVGLLNRLLNHCYQFMLAQLPPESYLRATRKLPGIFGMAQLTDEQILSALQALEAAKEPIPFVGLIGLVILTLGFILQVI